MTSQSKIRNQQTSRKGAATVVFVVLLYVIIVLGVFASEYAHLKLTKTELRIAVDACARAASAEYGASRDLDAAITAAQDMAQRYRVGRVPFSIERSEVVSGSVLPHPDGTYAFLEGGTPINAFRIETGYTDQTRLGSMDSIFPAMHGIEQFQILSRSTVAEIDLEIVLVLDRSGSMAFDLSGVEWQYPDGRPWNINYFLPPDPEGSRWAALEGALNLFVDVLDRKTKKVPVAITSYSTNYSTYSSYFRRTFSSVEASLDQPLTENYQLVRDCFEEIGSHAIIGGTNISAGMDLGTQVLTQSPNSDHTYQIMIVLTDGQWNAGRDPVLAAIDAANQGIKIYAVTFSENADIETMQNVADVGGGEMYHAVTQEELEDAFRQIANSLEMVFVE
jgi:hypothetical protein